VDNRACSRIHGRPEYLAPLKILESRHKVGHKHTAFPRWAPIGLVCAAKLRKFWRAAPWKLKINHKFQARDNQLQSAITHIRTPLLHQPGLVSTRQTCTMADALKAEGNKAFAAKNFDEAMYVQAAKEPNVVLTYVLL
jgi:hypothetical protein